MVLSAYYNSENDVLTISRATSKLATSVETKENITIIKIEDEVYGINILNPQIKEWNEIIDINTITEINLKEYFGDKLENPFVVGKVIEKSKHKKSEKLSVCQIDLGGVINQIVCGAQNIDKGQKVIIAKPGAVMLNGMSILPSKLLDEPSSGMVCSYKELGKEQNTPGIAVLEDNYIIGQDYF